MAAVGSFVLLQVVRILTGGLRLSEADEYDGLDLTQHGESGYNFEESFPATMIEDSGPVFAHSS
jgi:ammonia channel protein AmtB